ncbi:probable extracellular repeat, HAF family [Halopelagius inordinatus]|uniref:Probable extracellular repeat, HAF family n=1 Tax=Halopelagius inordinatus TaxID=553467 RepID=A0A1I2WJT2_9EURY|nr:probable extracellular repeat, HAF family [Halopelagius inordinatus]
MITDLGTLDGGAVSDAADINDCGTVVGTSETDVDGAVFVHAVLWDADGDPHSLGTFRSDDRAESRATGVNDRGTVVGAAEGEDRVRRAFRRTEGGELEDLGSLGGSERGDSIAYDVNDRETVVGQSDAGESEVRAFRWTGGEMEDLGTLRSDDTGQSGAFAVDNAGTVVGWSESDDGTNHAVRWTEAEGMEDLGMLEDHGVSYAFDVTPHGTVVGRSYDPGAFDSRRAVRWVGGGVESLGTLDGDAGYSEAHGSNVRGVVVGDSRVGDVEHAFRWTEAEGMTDMGTLLDGDEGASTASGVNARGDVVGASRTPEGERHAVRWRVEDSR